jgi:hypothetical protein
VALTHKRCRPRWASRLFHFPHKLEMGIEPNNKSSVLFGSLFESSRFCSVRFGVSFYKVRVRFGSQV